MKRLTILVGALVVGATALAAQSPKVKPEIRPFAGAIIPTGDQRDLFLDAPMAGVSVAFEVRPTFHVLGTFGWVAGQNKYPVAQNNVNIYMYTVGAELGFVKPLAGRWELRPFLGAGVGGRTYAYQGIGLDNQTCTAGYGALGTEFQLARTALRLEARDNLFCFKSPVAGVSSKTRNDIGLSLGVAYHFR